MSLADLHGPVAALLEKAGLRGEFTVSPLKGGANNRVFRVQAGGKSLLLKAYFRHPDDPRDRLGHEFAFSRFAWERGLRCLPEPLAADPENALGLYQFIEGRPPTPADLTPSAIDQALAFYTELNAHKQHPDAARLPNGSEACFSLRDHLRTVERRIERLEAVEACEDIQHEVVGFVQNELTPQWKAAAAQIEAQNELADLLPPTDRCLSPSDFGFHNALIEASGRLIFIDFEYAGWDDPAKLVCDFFCQPAVPVPLDYFSAFAAQVTANLSHPSRGRDRIDLLLPLYRIKWCCILLNDFLPTSRARRRFALAEAGESERLRQQLEKARAMLAQVSL